MAAVMALGVAVVLATPSVATAAIGDTTIGSLAPAGVQANDESWHSNFTGDGGQMVFSSVATNLIASDTNATSDVFVRNRRTGAVQCVSVASTGEQANKQSDMAKITPDGRYVVFESDATNLAPGDTNNDVDVFVHDMNTGVTTRVSVASDGSGANAYSHDSDISADGRYVVFSSEATNLVANDSNGDEDIFVRDLVEHTTKRVSVRTVMIGDVPLNLQADNFSGAPCISADGRFVAFSSAAENLVANDNNGQADIFVRDLQSATTTSTTRVSISSTGVEADRRCDDAAISADGRFIVFGTSSTTLVPGDTDNIWDVCLRDRTAGTTSLVSLSQLGAQGNGESADAVISADGSRVAFSSLASNLVIGDTNGLRDIFVRNLTTHTTSRLSRSTSGVPADKACWEPSLSADGRWVGFESDSDKLVLNDVNNKADVFVHQLAEGKSGIMFSKAEEILYYKKPAHLSAHLTGEIIGDLSGLPVVLQKLSGPTWVDIATALTDVSGVARFAPIQTSATRYRVRFDGVASAWLGCYGDEELTITPPAYLGKPNAPKTMRKNRYYTISATLKPEHAKGKIVRIYKFKKVKVKGKWVWKSKGYVKAKVYNPKGKSYSKYKVRMRLTSKGSWALSARMMPDASHADSLSKSDYVKVK
ncbi:MAG TPA: hypothetical protein VFG89_08975 [Coriobacteriia bacterium]|nr:hypothetical protein [Coriobacteriia bacterium]